MAHCEECGEYIRCAGQICWETGGECYAEISSRRSGLSGSGEVAIYKGRKYPVLWKGNTKYGYRAKLGFWDGSKSFWVDASKLG